MPVIGSHRKHETSVSRVATISGERAADLCGECEMGASAEMSTTEWNVDMQSLQVFGSSGRNACCNILKAFLFQVFVGRRPFHLMNRDCRQEIMDGRTAAPAGSSKAKGTGKREGGRPSKENVVDTAARKSRHLCPVLLLFLFLIPLFPF